LAQTFYDFPVGADIQRQNRWKANYLKPVLERVKSNFGFLEKNCAGLETFGSQKLARSWEKLRAAAKNCARLKKYCAGLSFLNRIGLMRN